MSPGPWHGASINAPVNSKNIFLFRSWDLWRRVSGEVVYFGRWSTAAGTIVNVTMAQLDGLRVMRVMPAR